MPFTAGQTQADLPERKRSDAQTVPAVAAVHNVSPHVKRPHQNAPFLPEDGEQPPKKPRVNDHDVTPSELAVPGRYPTLDAGVVSVTETTKPESSSAGPAAPDIANVESVKTTEPQAASAETVTAPPSTQKLGPSLPSTSQTAAPIVPSVVVASPEDDKKMVHSGISSKDPVPTKNMASASHPNPSTRPLTSKTSEYAEPSLPATAQNLDGSSRPINPAAVLATNEAVNDKTKNPPGTKAVAASEPEPQETPTAQPLTDAANTEPNAHAPDNSTAKKGGFIAWVKRVFKGGKSEKAASATKGH